MSVQRHLRLAESLPPRLKTFFEKYPPPSLYTASAPIAETSSTTAPSEPNAVPNAPEATLAEPATSEFHIPRSVPPEAQANLPYPNPFLPRKNHTTGRWYGPVYGLRQQADLVKLAQKHHVVDLLPWTIKKPGMKEQRRIDKGLQVKGTGEGQKVKGKLWERTLKGRLEMRRKAMLEMPALIQEWKQVSGAWARRWKSIADIFAEGTWSWMEEIPLGQGEIDGGNWEGVGKHWARRLVLDWTSVVYSMCTRKVDFALDWSCCIKLGALYSMRGFISGYIVVIDMEICKNADMQFNVGLELSSDLAENGYPSDSMLTEVSQCRGQACAIITIQSVSRRHYFVLHAITNENHAIAIFTNAFPSGLSTYPPIYITISSSPKDR